MPDGVVKDACSKSPFVTPQSTIEKTLRPQWYSTPFRIEVHPSNTAGREGLASFLGFLANIFSRCFITLLKDVLQRLRLNNVSVSSDLLCKISC
jgi:hypothetical protein